MKNTIHKIQQGLIGLLLLTACNTLSAQGCGVTELKWTVDGEEMDNLSVLCSAPGVIGVAVKREGAENFENLNCMNDLGDLSFTWSDSTLGAGPCVFAEAPGLLAAGTYSVIVGCTEGELGSVLSNQLSITITPIPDFEIIAGGCNTDSVTLSASELPNDQSLSYTWRRGMQVMGNGTTLTVSVPELENIASYSLSIAKENCTETRQITLRGNELRPVLRVMPSDTLACRNGTVTVMASSVSSSVTGFKWERDEDGATGGFNEVGEADLGVGTYRISTVGNGCSAVAEVVVLKIPGPGSPELMVEIPAELCEDSREELTIEEQPNVNYSWRNLAGEELSTATSFAAGPGVIEVYAIDAAGCDSEPTVISIDTLDGHMPILEVSASAPYCAGDSLRLTAANLMGATATWSTEESGPEITVTTGGTYTVTYEGGALCAASATRIIPEFGAAPVLPQQPDASAISGNTATIALDLGDAFGVQVPLGLIEEQNATVAQVSLDGNDQLSFRATGTAGARATGAIRFTLIPESMEGCVGPPQTLLVRVVPEVEEPFIPEIISPNGDGSNDTWAVIFPAGEIGYDVVVYSRGGAVVFSGTEDQLPWNAGTCPNGVYYYQISERGPEGRRWQGALTIIGRASR